ncbi:MAG TPA: carboxypeptidase-like regulatory domain-containing protein [Cytophagaceae bacterium]|jgi:hypothetical protein|nr:carboxypeptidase-like regulatory domain-containing protein [Cytophagaceae bacterium]
MKEQAVLFLSAHNRMRSLFLIVFTVFLVFQVADIKAQGKPKIIQFSGLVVSGDSSYGIPNVHIYIPKSGRGTTSNFLGYFSMPTLEGDTVAIRAIGYREKMFAVPSHLEDDKWSLIVSLSEDTLTLPDVEVLPWPTEKIFKEAFIALKLPEQEMSNMNKNLNDQVMKRMMYNMGADGYSNHRYYMDQQINKQNNRFFAPTISLLNPFAWRQFIQSVKKGELKKKSKDNDD